MIPILILFGLAVLFPLLVRLISEHAAKETPCDCQHPLNYVEDMCEAHQEAYDEYCRETAPEDRMGVTVWFDWYTKSHDRCPAPRTCGGTTA